jgi:hypothetical protein
MQPLLPGLARTGSRIHLPPRVRTRVDIAVARLVEITIADFMLSFRRSVCELLRIMVISLTAFILMTSGNYVSAAEQVQYNELLVDVDMLGFCSMDDLAPIMEIEQLKEEKK